MIEHHETVCEDLQAADRLLARYFGTTTQVRREIADMIARHTAYIQLERRKTGANKERAGVTTAPAP